MLLFTDRSWCCSLEKESAIEVKSTNCKKNIAKYRAIV